MPGEIQVTRSVYERLKGKFEFESRGAIQVKGKGEIDTFLLHGRVVAEEVVVVKVRILGSSMDDTAPRQYVSSYLINETIAVDAGCLGLHGTPREQEGDPARIPYPFTLRPYRDPAHFRRKCVDADGGMPSDLW